MEHFNTALTSHFKRYLNTLSVPLADQAVFSQTPTASYARFEPAAASLQQALSMPRMEQNIIWRTALSHLQQARPALSPWHGTAHWQTALGRLQQGISGEELLLPEDLLDEGVEDDLLALPEMPDTDDLLDLDMDGGSAELDALFAEAPAAAPVTSASPHQQAVEAIPAEVSESVAALSEADENMLEAESPHIHVSAGQTTAQAASIAAPQAAQNPVLAATQQALRSAEAAATQATEAAAAPTLVLDVKTQSSKDFFSRLPWGGTQSS